MFTEAVLGAIVQAVFTHLDERVKPVDRLLQLTPTSLQNTLDPKQRAFKHALGVAGKKVEHLYPQQVAELFDASFFKHEGASFLADFLTRHRAPNARDLVKAWADSLGLPLERRSRVVNELLPVGEYLIACLEDALLLEEDLAELHNQRDQFRSRQALEAIQVELANAVSTVERDQISATVPIVIFAMNRDEAKQLKSKEVFVPKRNNPKLNKFNEFLRLLKKHKIDDFIEFYGDQRDDWHLPFMKTQTVRQYIETHVQNANNANVAEGFTVKPKFESENFLSVDENICGRTWHKIAERAILIVDAISLFHPRLQRLLTHSGFDNQGTVPMVLLSPIDTELPPLHQFVIDSTGAGEDQLGLTNA
ncbi:MAG TPA: hypothetical protein P5280_18510, partial [Cyclobacteriaceae bacterium]|nr:hypothetical protein [Cyclobacteriaceae bacterium]